MSEDLTRLLEYQLKIEEDSIILYDGFISRIDDDSISKKIQAIRDSEKVHVELVKEMLGIVNDKQLDSGKTGSEQKKSETDAIAKEDLFDISGFMEEYGNLHIHTKMENYSSVIKKLIEDLRLPTLYISYNKVLKYTKSFLEKENIDFSNVKFVSCIVNDEGGYIDPSALTDISIEIGEFIDQNRNSRVIIDSISGFSVYHDEEKILKFISTINSRCQTADAGPVWISINIETDDEFKNKISSLCSRFFDV